jgi:CubicO group peptidase (beta-lactamase class C family)
MAPMVLFAYFFSAAILCQPVVPTGYSPLTATIIEQRRQELVADRFGSLFAEFAAREGFNGDVLLSQNGRIVYKNAFGYADLRLKTPLHIESVFQLASVSKQFTSAAIMILHDQGKLDFDDPIQKYFPDLPYQTVTIRQLLGHRSGIPDYMNFAGRYWRNRRELLANSDVLEMLVTHRPNPEFTPGKRYRYSNTNYALLASLIEKLSGQHYSEFMKQHVFAPLGMNDTFVFDPNNRQIPAYQTIGYNHNCRPADEDFLSGVVGDKGIYSTVDDMFKWDQALYTDTLVKRPTLDEAFTPLHRDFKRESNYGFGWRIMSPENGKTIIYHAGWWRGYNSLDVRRLEDKTFIIVLSNKVNWCFRNIDHLLEVVDTAGKGVMAMHGNEEASE